MSPIFEKLLSGQLQYFDKYFLPWPEWLNLTEDVFFFDQDRGESFNDCITYRLSQEKKFRPEPITDTEKEILKGQYRTLYIVADEIFAKNTEKLVNNKIWYTICTTETLYRPIKNIINFALRFLTRD